MSDKPVTGKRISELEKVSDIKKDSTFLLTRFDQVAREVAGSYGLQYDILSTQLFEDVRKMLNVRSMVYENKYSYSKITHLHDYSNVDMEVFYGPDSKLSGLPSKMVDLATIDISNYNSVKHLHLCVPYVKFEKPKDYRIGELKFVYISSDNVDYELETKGYTPAYGWVIPDGKTYSREDYPDAYEVYGDEKTSKTTFKVPTISGFFRLNPGLNTTSPMESYSYHNSQVKHKHHIHQKAQLGHVDMSVMFELTSTQYAVSDPESTVCAHCGGGLSSDYPGGQGAVTTGQINIETDVIGGVVTVTGSEIYECPSDDTESYPTHDTFVAVLYIGDKGQEEEE